MSLQTAYTQAFLHIYTVERKNDLASPEGTPNQQSRSLIHICFVFCHKFHSVHRLKVLPQMRIKALPQKYKCLFKLAKFGLILVVLIWLSILFCIDNMCLFHTLFFVSHIFSTIPVPLHFFIIVCSSGGLQVGLLFTE